MPLSTGEKVGIGVGAGGLALLLLWWLWPKPKASTCIPAPCGAGYVMSPLNSGCCWPNPSTGCPSTPALPGCSGGACPSGESCLGGRVCVGMDQVGAIGALANGGEGVGTAGDPVAISLVNAPTTEWTLLAGPRSSGAKPVAAALVTEPYGAAIGVTGPFFAPIEWPGGELVTLHVPNTGVVGASGQSFTAQWVVLFDDNTCLRSNPNVVGLFP